MISNIMKNMELKPLFVQDWKLVEELEKGSENVFFCSCNGEEGFKKYLVESRVFAVMKEGVAIGTISYKDEGENILINGLTVLPEYRGQGIAQESMKKLMTTLGNKNCSLVVHPENTPALLIYLHIGFVIKEWRDNFFGNNQPRLYLVKKNQ